MNSLRNVCIWLSKPNHQKTLAFIGGGLAIAIGGVWQAYLQFSERPKQTTTIPTPNGVITAGRSVSSTASTGGVAVVTTGNVTIGITREQYEAGLKRKEQDTRAEIAQASAADKDKLALLEKELTDVQTKLNNPEAGLEEYKNKLAQAYRALADLKQEIPHKELKQAQQALAKGETADAENIFQKVLSQGNKEKAAEAAHQLVQLAYDRIDYTAAYQYSKEAADLQPDTSLYLKAPGKIPYTALTGSDRLPAAEATLGQYPLCEASAALLVACPDGKGECLLVGDNEQKKKLYLFSVNGQKLDSSTQRIFDLGSNAEISDIEALAGVSGDKVLAFASHSRNTNCEIKPKRHQFGKINLSKAKTEVIDTLRFKKITCEHLFDKRVSDMDVVPVQAACKAIDTADAKATEIDDAGRTRKLTDDVAKARCNAVNVYKAEGAVAIDTAKGTDMWIGLRAPLLSVHPSQSEKKNLAILLHMKDLTTYTFDRVAFVDLGGRGVRDLSSDATSIWVIAGPPEDRAEPFELRRFSKSALDKTEVIDSELINSALPPSSEGLAISGKTAYIVIDGVTAKNVCEKPASYKIVSLP
jgi:tetratricopeptide (TPR) repeat protein